MDLTRLGVRPPIILNEHGSIDVFQSTEAAEIYMEPIDVENGEYVAYDSEGRLLRIVPTSPRVTIETAELEPSHQDEVRALLVRLLTHLGVPKEELLNLSLGALVKRSLQYEAK